MTVKDYLDTNDFTKEELLDMIELARSMKGDLYRFFGHEVKRFLNLNLVISYLPKKECSDDEFTNEVHRRIPA